ncbi:putative calcium-binding protein [Arachis hypogaea]|uniref:Putative calcium-binding protein n=1 Tax=Arachis hypogaea TaxID=3818 RepID=A0A6B9V877_ARAHY|nr:putative calcium-binding protein [Arachis hypogaea]
MSSSGTDPSKFCEETGLALRERELLDLIHHLLSSASNKTAIFAVVSAAISTAGTVTTAVSVAVESFWIREVDVGPDGKIRYEDFIARMLFPYCCFFFFIDPVFIPIPDNSANKRRFALSCP